LGGLAAVLALAAYLTWRVLCTLPPAGTDRTIAWVLLVFEALPILGLAVKLATLWTIDSHAPPPVSEVPDGLRVTVLIPTYNEPSEVISPTIAAACALQPGHETWVLDDGDREWVRQLAEACGARYVTRPVHDHAKAGNLNHAIALLEQERADLPGEDVIAVLDCDHVPLPHFLTATLGWFADEQVALVQGPQAFYNAGAFDDDGSSGEQGLFFNVQMPARSRVGAGPFWCGSTSLLRVRALRSVGGVATETITEDLHTTLKLIRTGWTAKYHHQTLAVGLAPATPDQYLLQRRRWGMGAMQIMVHERLWAARTWMSWRAFYEYLNGTLWWLEGIATLVAFAIPVTILVTGAETSTAAPLAFLAAFLAMFTIRLWGTRRLLRKQIRWSTAFALRVFRIPVGLACAWWLASRRVLAFEVTPKGAATERRRGRVPVLLTALCTTAAAILTYAIAGALGWVPWETSTASTLAAGAWLAVATGVLVCGSLRIRASVYATSRRRAHRFGLHAPVLVDGQPGDLCDLSVGGAAIVVPARPVALGDVVVMTLPGAEPTGLTVVDARPEGTDGLLLSLAVVDGDWRALQQQSLWLFHTPSGAVPGLPTGVPAVAVVD
jgi:cellulose synthase (UDP-forming)